MERKDAVGVASCPEWYGPFCCTGLEQLFYSHSNNPSWVYWLSRKGSGDGKNVNEQVWLLPKALRLKLTSPCILWPWATFHCNYLVLLQPFWSKGQYTNVCDIACIFIFPVWKWKKKKEGGEKLHAVSRVQNPSCTVPLHLAVIAALAFSCPKLVGLLLQNSRWCFTFLSIIQVVCRWRGRHSGD